MHTTSQLGLRDLVEVLRPTDPVASVYIGSAQAYSNRIPWQTRWHRLADQLRSDGAEEPLVGWLEVALREHVANGAEIVAFASRHWWPRVFTTPGLAHFDLAWFTSPAYVLPVLSWLQDRPPCVVVVASRNGIDLHVIRGGSRTGAWTSPRRPRDAGAVARACEVALHQVDARLLMVCGDRHTTELVAGHLSPGIRKSVTIRRIGSAPHGRSSQVAAATRAATRQWTSETLTDFADRCRTRGLGVEGSAATLGALAEGRVRELLVEYPEDVTAAAWFGERAGEILPGDRLPPADWPQRRCGQLAGVAVRSALLSGARVQLVPRDTLDDDADGIAGVCRSPLAVVRL